MAVRRGVVLILSLILLAVFVSMAGILLLSIFARPTVTVPASATLTLPIDAPWSEIEPSDVLQLFNAPPALKTTIDTIRRAKQDTRIKALLIRPSAQAALWAQLQEVRAAIEDFKTSGKPVVAFLESAGTGDYYLATAATRIVLMPAGQLDLAGLASYELFFRGTLDKIGVYPDLLHIGDYKTASNTFTERDFTREHREMTTAINQDWYDELVRAIAAGRNVSVEAARALIDDGPYLAEAALAAGLVDELAYDDQLDDREPIQGTRSITRDEYTRAVNLTQSGSGRIALLYAAGVIASGKSSFDSPTSGLVVGSDTFAEWVRRVRVDPSIAAVVVRIDSPGGSAIASEVIWRELMLTRDVKPLVVSMGDVAASGGYYIAAPAHTIVAQPGTLTGSIGVVTGKFVLGDALDKLGVGTGTVSHGRLAEIYSPFRPFSAAERTKLSAQMRATYDLFVSRVADGRAQTSARIDEVAQGRVWTGRQAHEHGLVDELGGLDDAIRLAAERARLDPAAGVSLVVYPAKRSLYDVLSQQFGSSSSGVTGALFQRPDVRAVQTAASMLTLFRRGEPLAILPNVFVR